MVAVSETLLSAQVTGLLASSEHFGSVPELEFYPGG